MNEPAILQAHSMITNEAECASRGMGRRRLNQPPCSARQVALASPLTHALQHTASVSRSQPFHNRLQAPKPGCWPKSAWKTSPPDPATVCE
jgi:hypothetical protein